jgi:hypothetical protein
MLCQVPHKRTIAAKKGHKTLRTAIPGLVDARSSTVRQHDLERVLARLADDKRTHLKRAAEQPGMPETGIGNVVFDGLVAMHRDAVARRAFPVQNNSVIVKLS